MVSAPPLLRTPLYSLTSAATPELSIRSSIARSTTTLAGRAATILSISSASAGALLISSDPRTIRVVSSLVRFTSNGAMSAPPDGDLRGWQSLVQPPQVRRPGLVRHVVEHGLRDVDAHAALGQRILVEIGRQRHDVVEVERAAVVLDLDQDVVAGQRDLDVDRPAAAALVRVDRDIVKDLHERRDHRRVERVADIEREGIRPPGIRLRGVRHQPSCLRDRAHRDRPVAKRTGYAEADRGGHLAWSIASR